MCYRLFAICYLLTFVFTVSCSNQQTGDLSTNSDPILTQLTSFFNNSCVGTIPQNLKSGAEFCIATNKATASNKNSLGKLYADDGKMYYYQTRPLYSTFDDITDGYQDISVNPQTTLWYLTSSGALISNPTQINADSAVIQYDSSSKQMTAYYYSSFTESQFKVVSSAPLTTSNAKSQAQAVLSTLIFRIKDMKSRYAKAIPAYMNTIGDKSQYCNTKDINNSKFAIKLGGIKYCNYLASAGGAVNNVNGATGAVPSIYPYNGDVYVLPAYLYNNLEQNPHNQVWYNKTNSPYAAPYENSNDDYSYYVFDPDNVVLSQWYYSSSQNLSVPVVQGFPAQPLSSQTNTNTGKWQPNARFAMAEASLLGPGGVALVTVGSILGGAATTIIVIGLIDSTGVTTLNALCLYILNRLAGSAAADSGPAAGAAVRAAMRLELAFVRVISSGSAPGVVATQSAQAAVGDAVSAIDAGQEAAVVDAEALAVTEGVLGGLDKV